jgi:hypothetical protein
MNTLERIEAAAKTLQSTHDKLECEIKVFGDGIIWVTAWIVPFVNTIDKPIWDAEFSSDGILLSSETISHAFDYPGIIEFIVEYAKQKENKQ